MNSSDYANWPFPVATVASRSPENVEQIKFLEAAYVAGYESFRFGVNDYGARSSSREGCVLERGRKRWEVRLTQGEERQLIAFVDDFNSAGRAIQEWLEGSLVKQIIHNIHDHLITPPGEKTSYRIAVNVDNAV